MGIVDRETCRRDVECVKKKVELKIDI